MTVRKGLRTNDAKQEKGSRRPWLHPDPIAFKGCACARFLTEAARNQRENRLDCWAEGGELVRVIARHYSARHSAKDSYRKFMSVEQLEQQIQRLPRQDLARLVGWLDGFLDRQAPEVPAESVDLTDDEQAELLRRRDELLANPDLAQPMGDDYFEGLKRELANARARQASGS